MVDKLLLVFQFFTNCVQPQTIMLNEGTKVEAGTPELEQNMPITEQLQFGELLSEELLQLLTHLKDLIECKQKNKKLNNMNKKLSILLI